MTLDEKYFDSLNVEVIKKKYYDASRINFLLEDIRQRAEELTQENKRLKEQVYELSGKKCEIGELLLEAQSTAKEITTRANGKADTIVKAARKEADEILSSARTRASEITKKAAFDANNIVNEAKAEEKKIMDRLSMVPDQQEYAAHCVEDCLNKLKAYHLDAVDMLNQQWQGFLSGLYMPETPKPEEEPCVQESRKSESAEKPEKTEETQVSYEMPYTETEAAADDADALFEFPDLEEKISAILTEMNAMEDL